MSKLSLDRDQVDQCRTQAAQIVRPILQNVSRHTTVSIERSTLRLLGVEGCSEENPKDPSPQGRYPLVNEVVDKIGRERLIKGAAYWFGLAAAHHSRLTPTTLARKIALGEIDLAKLEPVPVEKIDEVCQAFFAKTVTKLRASVEKRKKRPAWRLSSAPLRYIIVATGDIREDVRQAQAAAEMGADIIAVIRSTAQSLLDYVPEGETTEGFGGTFATQENFKIMRAALDQSEKQLKRRIALTNYSSGLCMPEIAVMGALEGIDYLLNDAMYGILFRDINMKRNFVDQHFSRRICALSGITIQTGEDNYLTTAESHKYYYQVIASHFINEAFAKAAGLPDVQIALGHAHEVDPWIEDSILYEWAQAQLVREIFPRNPIKFMPPTKHKSGDIFFSYLYDGLFNLASILTGQTIHLLGMHTEAIHNPWVQDRFLSLKNAAYVFKGAKSIQDEVFFQPNGKITRRARQVLDEALSHLKKVRGRSLMGAIEEGAFAAVKRGVDEGKGLDGVFEKDRDYYTPLKEYLTPKQEVREEPRQRRYEDRDEDRRIRGGRTAGGRDDARVRPEETGAGAGEGSGREEGRPREEGRGRGRERDGRGRDGRSRDGRGREGGGREGGRDRGGRDRGRGRDNRGRGPRPAAPAPNNLEGAPLSENSAPMNPPAAMEAPIQHLSVEIESRSEEIIALPAVSETRRRLETPEDFHNDQMAFAGRADEGEEGGEGGPAGEAGGATDSEGRPRRGRRRGRRGGRGRRNGGRRGPRPEGQENGGGQAPSGGSDTAPSSGGNGGGGGDTEG